MKRALRQATCSTCCCRSTGPENPRKFYTLGFGGGFGAFIYNIFYIHARPHAHAHTHSELDERLVAPASDVHTHTHNTRAHTKSYGFAYARLVHGGCEDISVTGQPREACLSFFTFMCVCVCVFYGSDDGNDDNDDVGSVGTDLSSPTSHICIPLRSDNRLYMNMYRCTTAMVDHRRVLGMHARCVVTRCGGDFCDRNRPDYRALNLMGENAESLLDVTF